MSVGIFTERKRAPTDDEITEAIGSRLSLWEALIRILREEYAVQEDWNYFI